jgi:hypothetical protein
MFRMPRRRRINTRSQAPSTSMPPTPDVTQGAGSTQDTSQENPAVALERFLKFQPPTFYGAAKQGQQDEQ